MRTRNFLIFCLASTLLASTGCVKQSSVKPFNKHIFFSGNVKLSCSSLTCAASWGTSISTIHKQYQWESWNDLARAVTSENYNTDLAYFYLGQAAEGLGKVEAAKKYYLSTRSARIKCKSVVNVCQGVDVPRMVSSRLSALAKLKKQPRNAMSLSDAQSRLAQLGYYKGTIDGIYGPRTGAAISSFQRSVDLPPTGKMDGDTENKLRMVKLDSKVNASSPPDTGINRISTTSKTKTSEVEKAPNPVESANQEFGILTSNAELLKTADPFSDVISTIRRHTRVKVLERDGEWARIKYNDSVGFIYADQIR